MSNDAWALLIHSLLFIFVSPFCEISISCFIHFQIDSLSLLVSCWNSIQEGFSKCQSYKRDSPLLIIHLVMIHFDEQNS